MDMIGKYYEGDEEVLPSIMEAVLKRRLSGKHEQTDDELMEKLKNLPMQEANDKEFDSDFDELSTDEEVENLYNARQLVEKRMVQDEFFNMDDKKWDDMIKEATEKGFLKDMGECEQILEDKLSWISFFLVSVFLFVSIDALSSACEISCPLGFFITKRTFGL